MNVNAFLERPRISLIELLGDSISLESGHIVTLVGPNNSGKTHFLDQLEAKLVGADSKTIDQNNGLTKSLAVEWGAVKNFSRDDVRRLARSVIGPENKHGFFDIEPLAGFDSPVNSRLENLIEDVNDGARLGAWTNYFVRRDSPLSRVSEADPQLLSEDSAFGRVYRDIELVKNVSEYFKRVFHEDISAYQSGSGQIAFKMGKKLGTSGSFEGGMSTGYLEQLNQVPKLWHQGLGMRSVIGLLVRIYADPRPIVLIDEPEAFLHPPQAAALGEVLKEISVTENRQFFCATHDKNFLSGISRQSRGQSRGGFSILRLSRQRKSSITERSEFGYRVIPANFDEDIRNTCKIRHSIILEGLFADVALVVENETDALFYEEALNYYWEGQAAPNTKRISIHFVSVSGKSNAPSTIQLLSLLETPVVTILDTDIIAEAKEFRNTLQRLKVSDVQKYMDCRDEMEKLVAKSEELPQPSQKDYKNKLKEAFAGKLKKISSESYIYSELEAMKALLRGTGLCVPPKGELEDFAREINSSKADWVRRALGEQIHMSPNVQDFIRSVVWECENRLSSKPKAK
ncbi:ATP-dependent nuclease [Corynebacterium aurimucosum]|uniref:ATP-dependent nuclease n=1 Tax=Corynebacterium aurimucosum TaxID=169292 RepID=UPI0009BAEC22|nr:ATP-binding protein [Corynebacterium aurimucosum]